MTIPFTKAHGARNDFLLTWAHEAPAGGHAETAVALCDRQTGIGADGWILVHPPDSEGCASIRLYNSDGSESGISGNGTRCAAALLVEAGLVSGEMAILTGAGLRHVFLLEREDNRYMFEMNMGIPRVLELHAAVPLSSGEREATLLDVGNPQCAIFVDNFAFDWRSVGAEVETHPLFPNRTNVSFVRAMDEHTIDVRFFERGAGVTMSSGTGSTGAAAAARARGLVTDRVTVLTPAGPLALRWQEESIWLTGPVGIIGRGEFYIPQT